MSTATWKFATALEDDGIDGGYGGIATGVDGRCRPADDVDEDDLLIS